MKVSTLMAGRSARWLLGMAVGGAVAYGGMSARQQLAPFGLVMPTQAGNSAADPREPVIVEALGLGARLTSVEAHDGSGKRLPGKLSASQFALEAPLAFGTRYTVKATVERPWLRQRETREATFTTVGIPKLEGATERALAPDASVALSFDRPVGKLEAVGDADFAVQPSPDHKTFRLVASHYTQGRTYPVKLNFETTTGVPVPPVKLDIATPPALSAEISNNGLSNLGLAIPVQVTFSEPVADREHLSQAVTVKTKDGKDIPGHWSWLNKTRAQFTPRSGWPASSSIRVAIEPAAVHSLRGGTLDKTQTASFSTGADRKIVVYLDTQQAIAIENGQPVKTFAVSTGKTATPTVTGSFYIYARFPTKTMRSRAKPGEKGHYVVEDVPYAQYFHEDYAFHGAWWHNGFGHPASHGCVNMATRKNNKRWPNSSEDAGWLYQWAALGVPVSVLPHSPTQVAANDDRAASAKAPAKSTVSQ